MPTIVSLGSSPNGAIEGLVRQKLRERNPNVSQAEVSAATQTVLADSGYTLDEATRLGVNAQVNITSLEPPPPEPAAAPVEPANNANITASAPAATGSGAANMPSFVLMPLQSSSGSTVMTPVPVVNSGQSFTVNGSQGFAIDNTPAQATPAAPAPPTRFALGVNGNITKLVTQKLTEINPNVTPAEISAAVAKVMADPANAAVLSDGPTMMMPTDEVELASILPPAPAPAPAPAPPTGQGEILQGGQRFAIIPNPFTPQAQGGAVQSPPAAATPGTNASANFNVFNNLLQQTLQNQSNGRQRTRSIPGVTDQPLLSQPFGNNGNIRLDDIASLPLPGNFNSAIGFGSLFNGVVGNIGGSNVLAQRGLFF
ncbi:MAG: hypothetical protein VKJ04_11445 [Vampirovibrionales bacterium]|nr:hypothetical protein [Vampirovibrionales bacterium]